MVWALRLSYTSSQLEPRPTTGAAFTHRHMLLLSSSLTSHSSGQAFDCLVPTLPITSTNSVRQHRTHSTRRTNCSNSTDSAKCTQQMQPHCVNGLRSPGKSRAVQTFRVYAVFCCGVRHQEIALLRAHHSARAAVSRQIARRTPSQPMRLGKSGCTAPQFGTGRRPPRRGAQPCTYPLERPSSCRG